MTLCSLPPDAVPIDPNVYQDTIWCANCGGPRVLIEVFRFDGGKLIACQGCGDERVVRFERTNSEAA